MSRRWLDPDADYAFDQMNRPPSNGKSQWIEEMERHAKQCLSFLPTETHPALRGVCKNCGGAKYAHTAHALLHKKVS